MFGQGIKLNLMVGPAVPTPAPLFLTNALESVEVSHKEKGRSGFQMTFQIGRRGPQDMFDYPQHLMPLVKPGNRVIMTVIIGAIPYVLSDGIITNQQHAPSNEPGQSKLSVTGEDVSIMMDQIQLTLPHPVMPDLAIVARILGTYAMYRIIPKIIPPPSTDVPLPLERIPGQTKITDLKMIEELAKRYGYVFHITPGPVPGMNEAYFGPPLHVTPQRALTVNMGASTNVKSINFQHDALKPEIVFGMLQDRKLNITMPVVAPSSLRIPPLSLMPSLIYNLPIMRIRELPPDDGAGKDVMQAMARAIGKVNSSADDSVTASGELDVSRYNGILWPRRIVGVRGAGFTYDGMYYVQNVTHKLKRGEYTQSFTLSREGVGSITPTVIP